MKNYYIQYNIGKCKYVVSFFDGVNTHNDGSPFYHIAIFRNKAKMYNFINGLISSNYIEK